MPDKEQILKIILEAIDDINATLPADRQISKDPQAVLYGPQGVVDSLVLTLLIVALEQKIEQCFHAPISLIGQSTAPGNNPFDNIHALQEYIAYLMG